MSLPAMPALIPIKRKTSVSQNGGEAGEEPAEARGDALFLVESLLIEERTLTSAAKAANQLQPLWHG